LNVNQIGFAFIGFFVLLWILDYRSEEFKAKRYKRNQWLYRVGKISLTVFTVESAVRLLWGHVWTWIIPGWDEALYVVFAFGLFNMLTWIIIAKLWEKVGYKGSVEWCLMKGIELATGKKSNKFESHSKTKPIEVETIVPKK
jgi:hypothetical protein